MKKALISRLHIKKRMEILTGPVLGVVSMECVRILLETGIAGDVKIDVENLQGNYTKSLILQTRKNRPVVAKFYDLLPGPHNYRIFDDQDRLLFSSSFTIPDPNSSPKITFVSCNALHTLKEGEVDLWKAMLRHHTSPTGMDFDMIIHIGDQIYEYTREVWQRGYRYLECIQKGNGKTTLGHLLKIDRELGFEEWDDDPDVVVNMKQVKDLVKELFRSLYRVSWNHAPQKEVMSRVSNHMILDDHDIRNGWGILPQDKDRNSLHYHMGLCAHEVYEEYQAQLWRDNNENFQLDHRILRKGTTGIFIMDVRNPRTFCYHKNAPYLGPEQMKDFQNFLRDDTLSDIIVVCSIPILMASEKITQLASHVDFSYDIQDSWALKEHSAEHAKVLTELELWKRKDIKRNALLVGGDIHFALYSQVRGNDGLLLYDQAVTSPITNQPTEGCLAFMQDLFFGKEFSMYGKFNVTHTWRHHSRNYLSVHLEDKEWNCFFHSASH